MAPAAAGAAPLIGTPVPVATSVGRYQKFEARVPVTGTVYANPYEFATTAGGALLQATFTAPSGAQTTIDGFWADGYTMTNPATGAVTAQAAQNGWRVRFTPTEAGTYRYTLRFQDGGGTAPAVSGAFTATASSANGFVRRQTGKTYLRFDSGAPYFPVGENLAWGAGQGIGTMKTYLDPLVANRANCIRVWLCYWGLELEWKAGTGPGLAGLKRYSQQNAFSLDWLLDYCAANGLYVELCLANHGQLQGVGGPNSQWATNPYSAANGGPCATPVSYFSNATAKATYKNKLRYLSARYAFSPNLLAWELYNELDLVDNYSSANTAAWCGEMAAYLKSVDPNRHLVSNSYAMSNGDAAVWNNASIDFTQTHLYQRRPDLETSLATAADALRAAHNKPYLSGEFGLETDNGLTVGTDPSGSSFRNTLWASAFNGSMGAGLTWWWDEWIHPRATTTYPLIKQLRNFMDANVNVATGNFAPVKPELRTLTGGTCTITPGYSGFQPPAYAATKAPYSALTIAADGTLAPAVLGRHLFGSWNPLQRNPPTFSFTMPTAGQASVKVAAIGVAATLTIKVDGVLVLSKVNPGANTTYNVNLTAGTHTLTLDNTGTDWLEIGALALTNFQPRVTGSALRDGNRLVGYVRLRDYQFQYLAANNQVAPPAVSGATLTVRSLTMGTSYTAKFTSVLTGAVLSSATLVAPATGVVTFPLPTLAWDAAFVVKPTGSARPAPTVEEPATAAIRPATLPELNLYPNPASAASAVAVELVEPLAGPVQYTLFDLTGRRCWTTTDPETAATVRRQAIPLAGLPAGAYVLHVHTPAGQRSARLVLE